MTSGAPSDRLELISIESEQIELELLPGIGGRLHRLRAFGHDLLRTPADPAMHLRDPHMWGGYVMAPWCNRIVAAPTDVDRRLVSVPANFADGSAIHGLVATSPWRLDDGILHVHGGGGGWPWPFACAQRVAVRDGDVAIELQLTSLGDVPMPAGIGLHPWFRRPLEARIDGAEVLPSNLDPEARFEPTGGDLDLRALRPMPEGVDASWGRLGDPAVVLRWPQLGVTATIHARSTSDLFVAAASPAGIDAVAIELQTNAPQGLRRYLRGEPGGLIGLAAGATLRLDIELSLSLDDATDAAYHA